MTAPPDSRDLLVYGQGPLDAVVPAWEAAIGRLGVQISFPPGFDPALHGGPLRAELQLGPGAPPWATSCHPGGAPLAVVLELTVELFAGPEPDAGAPGAAPPEDTLEAAVARSAFCAMFTLARRQSPGAWVASVIAAIGLAEATGGVVVEAETDRIWSPPAALEHAERYLSQELASLC